MVTKNLFKSKSSNSNRAVALKVPATNTVNNAGGTAYSLSDKGALAQFAMTGCFNGTYYCSSANSSSTNSTSYIQHNDYNDNNSTNVSISVRHGAVR